MAEISMDFSTRWGSTGPGLERMPHLSLRPSEAMMGQAPTGQRPYPTGLGGCLDPVE